jgi:hypothetical protein
MGGYLSNPVEQWPNVFGDSQLLKAYPYALPGIACGGYCGLTIVLCVGYLREVSDLLWSCTCRPESTQSDACSQTRPDECNSSTTIKDILSHRLLQMLVIFGWTVTVIFCLNALFPLYLFTPVSLGGMDKTPPQIARINASSACFQGLWLLIAMPRLDRWLGTRKLFNIIAAMLPLQMLNPIIANALVRKGHSRAAMIFIGSYATVGQLVNMSFSECEAISLGIARVDRDTVQC